MDGVQRGLDVHVERLVVEHVVQHLGLRPIRILQAGVPHRVGVAPASPEAVEREAVGVDHASLAREDGLRVRVVLRVVHRAAHALGDDDGLVVGGHVVAVTLGKRGVLVDKVLHEVLHVLRHVIERVVAAVPCDALGLGDFRGLLHVGAARVAVELALARTAVAGGLVGVAGDARQDLQGTAVLDGVAVLVGGQLEVHAAVAVARVDAGGVVLAGLFDLRPLHAGDLRDLFRAVLAGQVMEAVPHGAALVLLAVDKLDLDFAGEQRGLFRQAHRVGGGALLVALVPVLIVGGIRRIGPRGLVGQPAVGNKARQRVLDERTGGRDLGSFALPLAHLRIPPGQTLVVLVPHHEAVHGAALFDVGFGDELRAHVDAAVALPAASGGQPRLIVAVQERGVRPAAHHGVVVSFVLDDPVNHAQCQRAVR